MCSIMSPPPLPTLAPRLPGRHVSTADKPSSKEHTEDEWEAKKGLVRRLYIQENRKLSEVMSILENKHGFAATQVELLSLL